MSEKLDLTGRKFGRWTVIKFHGVSGKNGTQYRWLCRCECGRKKPVLYAALATGTSRSCGCLHRELLRNRRRPTSSLDHPREYRIWLSMKTRCLNSRHPSFRNYGGRGIRICESWCKSFTAFFADMGEAGGLSIDRIDNAKGYEPGNCRWATRVEQNNNKRTNVIWDWKGQRRSLAEIAKLEGVDYCSMYVRMFQKGYTLEDAVDYCWTRGLVWKRRHEPRGVVV